MMPKNITSAFLFNNYLLKIVKLHYNLNQLHTYMKKALVGTAILSRAER